MVDAVDAEQQTGGGSASFAGVGEVLTVDPPLLRNFAEECGEHAANIRAVKETMGGATIPLSAWSGLLEAFDGMLAQTCTFGVVYAEVQRAAMERLETIAERFDHLSTRLVATATELTLADEENSADIEGAGR